MCCRPAGPNHYRFCALVTVALVAFAGCGAVDSPEPTRDEHTDPDGPTAEAASAGGKADIYGRDGRREYFEIEDGPVRRVADATAMLLDAGQLEHHDGAGPAWTADDSPLEETRGVCERERFSDQPAPGDCSGFLVAPDTLVTAGHCVDDARDCEQTRAVFGFRYENSTDEDVTEFPERDVYRCDDIVRRTNADGGPDFAVLTLDRPVAGRTPVEYRRTGTIADETPLAMVGHPVGLPLKVDRGGRVVDNEAAHGIDYNLDSYRGNSGSAVVDPTTGRVEAVHVHGSPDFRPDLEKSCLVSYECAKVTPGTRCRGNGGTRATEFAPYVRPEAGEDGVYRLTDTDDTLERTDQTVTAEIYVPAIGEIEQLRVVTRLAAGDRARIGLRLERGTDEGGDAVRLLQDQMLAGKWRRDYPVAKYGGRQAEGIWRIVVESDAPSRLEIETLALEIETK